MKIFRIFIFCALATTIASCNIPPKKNKILKQNDFPAPPVAEIIPDTFVNFGKQRIDNYFWMKDKNNPKVIDYIKAENAYTDTVMASTKDLQNTIYDEIIGRIKEDDESYPLLKNGYYYYSRSEKGKQYPIYLRKKGSLDASEEVIFDLNKMAEGKKTFIFGGYSISPDNNKVAYFYNETGSFAEYIMKIKDLTSGKDIGFSVNGASSVAWANDNNTLFYTTINKALRSCKINRQKLNESKETVVYEEKDPKFSTYVSGEKTRQYIFISCASFTTSEELFISADKPMDTFKTFLPRKKDVDYLVETHKDKFFVRYKDRANLNGMIYEVPKIGYEDRNTWKIFVPHNENVRIDGIDIMKDFVALELRKNGLNEIQLKPINGGETKKITFPEPVYTASLGGNPEYDATTIRYSYTSLNRPNTLYEYNINTNKSKVLKEQEIPSGFNPDDYSVERLWATAEDGVKIPIAIVYKKDMEKDGKNPTLLYSYGSYGHPTDVHFNSSVYSLINRGFIYAIAQVRGGSDLGEKWYEDGKLLKKRNTFTDFIACSKKLIEEGYTSPDRLTAMGGSAGGLLMGAVANMCPNLYQTIVAQVPFVDIINTMLDESLPLTTGEYEEWGNPNEEEYYNYMLSYSPYDNIKAQNYPNMLVTGGLNDSQVLFHEPTKYVAKLRAMKTDNNILLLHMNMDSGHGGASGRYKSIENRAFSYAFILNRVGINR